MNTINSTRTHECVQHSPTQFLQCPGVMPNLGYMGMVYGPTQRPKQERHLGGSGFLYPTRNCGSYFLLVTQFLTLTCPPDPVSVVQQQYWRLRKQLVWLSVCVVCLLASTSHTKYDWNRFCLIWWKMCVCMYEFSDILSLIPEPERLAVHGRTYSHFTEGRLQYSVQLSAQCNDWNTYCLLTYKFHGLCQQKQGPVQLIVFSFQCNWFKLQIDPTAEVSPADFSKFPCNCTRQAVWTSCCGDV